MRLAVLAAVAGCSFAPGHTDTPQDGAPGTADAPAHADAGRDATPGAPDAPPDAAVANIAFVQGANASSNGAIVQVTLATQAAGDLDVVAVSWGGAGVTVASITDSDGNSFQQVGSNVIAGGVGVLAVYYAANVKAGATTDQITVTLSSNVFPILMAAEYAGLATSNPLDTMSAGTGNNKALDSGAATTAHPHDLVVGIAASAGDVTAGSGYALRVKTGLDLVEDDVVTAAGSYHTSATLQSSNLWSMALVAFKGAD